MTSHFNAPQATACPAPYSPAYLLDYVITRLRLKNDRALAQRLQLCCPTISKTRHNKLSVSPYLLITLHEETGLSIRDLRFLSGDFRAHTGRSAEWIGAQQFADWRQAPPIRNCHAPQFSVDACART